MNNFWNTTSEEEIHWGGNRWVYVSSSMVYLHLDMIYLQIKKKYTIIFVFLYIDLDFKFANYACPEIVDGSVNIDRDSHST